MAKSLSIVQILKLISFIAVLLLFFAGSLAAQTDTSGVGIKRRGGAVTLPDSTIASPTDSTILPVAVLDSIIADSAATVKTGKPFFVKRFFTKGYPNPRKAALMSLVIPGAGQAYNKKWWKIPIVYGVLGGLTWLEIQSINDYKFLKVNYAAMVDGDPATVVTDPNLLSQDAVTVKAARDSARKTLEQRSLLLGLGYLLSVSDAFVDAHLSTFDVSDDLSMKLCPKSIPVYGVGPAFGLALVFTPE